MSVRSWGGRHAGAAQADHVEAAGARRVAVRDHEREAVLRRTWRCRRPWPAAPPGRTGGRPTPPPRNARSPTSTWPASMTLLAMIDAVADAVVVGHVHVRHQEAVGAHHGGPAGLRRAVDGHALADHVAVADHERGLLALEGQVLRLAAEDGALVHAVAGAQRGEPLDHGVGADLAAVADRPCAPRSRRTGPTTTSGPRRASGETIAVACTLMRAHSTSGPARGARPSGLARVGLGDSSHA